MPTVNDIAPDFTLVDQDKAPHTLSDYRGKKVVLAFYPAAFTGVCTKEMCTFQDSLAQLNDANAVVFGISPNSPFTQKAFADANGITFRLLADYDRQAVRAYGLALDDFAGLTNFTASHRAVYVVDETGQITYEWVGPHPGHEPDYEAVLSALA